MLITTWKTQRTSVKEQGTGWLNSYGAVSRGRAVAYQCGFLSAIQLGKTTYKLRGGRVNFMAPFMATM